MSENDSDKATDNPEALLLDVRDYLKELVQEIELLKERVDKLEKTIGQSKD